MSGLATRTAFDAWTGRMVRCLRRRHNAQCVNVVTYHSVSKVGSVFTDGTGLRHDPASFERQVEYLASCFNPISLRDLVEALAAGETVRRAVVITFDDGFADTVRVAFPVLYRRRIPATVFPVTSVIGNKELMWQHKLAWLTAKGHESRVCDAVASAGLGRRGEGESAWGLARRCYCEEMPAVLEDVLRSVGATGARLAGALRPYLEAEDVAEADPALMEFGNHTHTHAVLSALSLERQRWEIETARDELVALTGYAPIGLAYPFGLKRHYGAEAERLARESGHRAALDMRRRLNVGCVDPFELSRKPATNDSQVTFEKMMEDWPSNAALGGRGCGG